MAALYLLIDALAVYRLTRLISKDQITAPLRNALIGHLCVDGNGDFRREWIIELLDCRWCVGMYVAGGVTFARWVFPTLWMPFAYLLAVACAAPLVARLEND